MAGARRGFLGRLGGLLILALLAAVAIQGWDTLVEAPWAHSWRGEPTLTGEWLGEFRAASGQRGVLYLDVVRMQFGRSGRTTSQLGPPLPTFDAEGRLCGLSDWTAWRTFWGSANRSGSVVHLRGGTTPGLGWSLGELDGNWSGEHLVLAGTLYNNGGEPHPEDERTPTQIALTRGTEADFEGRCRQLGLSTAL